MASTLHQPTTQIVPPTQQAYVPWSMVSPFIWFKCVYFFPISRGLQRRPMSPRVVSTSSILLLIDTIVSAVPTSSLYRVLYIPSQLATVRSGLEAISTYPTSARSFSLLLAMSRRSSCSTRRTVGTGYWNASCHVFRLCGSGPSDVIMNGGRTPM